MAKLQLSPPWDIHYQKIMAMFGQDSDVHIVYDRDELEIKLYVEGNKKAEALSELLLNEVDFGGNCLRIVVIPSNVVCDYMSENKYYTAFQSNPAFRYARTYRQAFASNDLTYVVFANKVVQYFTDSLGDIHGLCSTLYQEIAKDIFVKEDGVFFCTDVPEETQDTYNMLF